MCFNNIIIIKMILGYYKYEEYLTAHLANLDVNHFGLTIEQED